MLTDDFDLDVEYSTAPKNSPTHIAQLEEAVRKADAANDLREGFAARMKLTEAATFGGRPDLVVLSFTWCLAKLDADPECFESEGREVLWNYKWVLNRLPLFSRVSRSQIMGALDDFATRLRREGYSPRTEFNCREEIAWSMGDAGEAETCHERKLNHPRDGLSDCVTCERRTDVYHLVRQGRDHDALVLAEPILAGRLTCAFEPAATMANTLCAFVRLGRGREGWLNHLRGYQCIRNDSGKLEYLGEHIKYLVLLGELSAGLAIFERHLPWAWETWDEAARRDFYFAGRRLLAKMAAANARTQIRVPSELMARAALPASAVSHVLDWLERQCHELAARFDQRNGNDFHMKTLQE
jgi:hypothetical protein